MFLKINPFEKGSITRHVQILCLGPYPQPTNNFLVDKRSSPLLATCCPCRGSIITNFVFVARIVTFSSPWLDVLEAVSNPREQHCDRVVSTFSHAISQNLRADHMASNETVWFRSPTDAQIYGVPQCEGGVSREKDVGQIGDLRTRGPSGSPAYLSGAELHRCLREATAPCYYVAASFNSPGAGRVIAAITHLNRICQSSTILRGNTNNEVYFREVSHIIFGGHLNLFFGLRGKPISYMTTTSLAPAS